MELHSMWQSLVAPGLQAFLVRLSGLLLAAVFVYWLGLPKPIPDIPYNKYAARRWLGDTPEFIEYFTRTGEGWDWMALQCEKLSSPIIQIFMGPFQRPVVILADQHEIWDIIVHRPKDFDRGGFLTRWLSSLVPHSTISMPTHTRFKAQRAIWQGTMTSDFINRICVPHMHRHIETLIKVWRTKAEVALGQPFEAQSDMRVTVFENIWSLAFGEDLGMMPKHLTKIGPSQTSTIHLPDQVVFPELIEPPIMGAVQYLIDSLDRARSSIIPPLHHLILQCTSAYRHASSVKRQSMRNLLAASKAKYYTADGAKAEVTCAMDHVYKRQAATAQRYGDASVGEMEDELFTYIVGGHESTQHNTSWGLKYLAQNPKAQQRLYDELSAAFPAADADHLPTSKDVILAHLPYLDACIEETLRIARTNAGSLRIAIRDTQVYGYHIPKGTDLFGAHTAESAVIELPALPSGRTGGADASKRRKPWPRGSLNTFAPERWLGEGGEQDGKWVFNPNNGPMMAFGAGLRSCYGQRLARTNMRMLFVMLMLSFEFQPIDGDKAGFEAVEKLVRAPRQAYVRLRVR